MLTKAQLRKAYAMKKRPIARRLSEFRQFGESGGMKALFSEMSFCICAANSSAKAAHRAQVELLRSGRLFSDDVRAISSILLKSHVRFHRNKARYLVETRKRLFESGEMLTRLGSENTYELREYLVKEANGIGYKEAGHYLRNIGRGEGVAILDRHILKNLKSLGVLDAVPKSLTRKKYLEIEGKMKMFADESGIPLSHLDLLFWSEETGRIFK